MGGQYAAFDQWSRYHETGPPDHQDAATIRGILDLFAESETIRTREVVMTQQISDDSARRLMRLLQKAGIVEHPTVTRIIVGASREVPCIDWRLTAAAKRGEIPDAEELVGGRSDDFAPKFEQKAELGGF
jgi:hypothetical protein